MKNCFRLNLVADKAKICGFKKLVAMEIRMRRKSKAVEGIIYIILSNISKDTAFCHQG